MQNVSSLTGKKKIKVRLIDTDGRLTITSLYNAEKYVKRGKARRLEDGDFELVSHRRQAGMSVPRPRAYIPDWYRAVYPECSPADVRFRDGRSVIPVWPEEGSLRRRKVKSLARSMDQVRSLFSDAAFTAQTDDQTETVRTGDELRSYRQAAQAKKNKCAELAESFDR